MTTEWKQVQPEALRAADLDNYEATSDWLEFDCVCADTNAPDYENIPYDFLIPSLAAHHFTCSRCGRQYRVYASVQVEMYEPLALRYPEATNRPPSVTLGLRDKE